MECQSPSLPTSRLERSRFAPNSDASKSELKSIENRRYPKLPGVDDSGSASVHFMIKVEGIGDVLNRWLKRFRLGIA
jgi:hypothetical protein